MTAEAVGRPQPVGTADPAERPGGDRRRPRSPLGLPAALRAVLPIWLLTRIGVLVLSLSAARVLGGHRADQVPGLLHIWDRWDVGLFTKVARYGYFSPAYRDHTEANFPGLPLAMRAVHLVVRNWVASGLLISLVAGGVACAALWRLAEDESTDADGGNGDRAVLFLVTFPYAVFLFAGYSEALFLGMALPAWLAARRDRWTLACLLACGASATRISGVPLVLALWVSYAVRLPRRRPARRELLREIPTLALPLAPVVAFLTYLRVRTGRWDAYTEAQKEGWGRALKPPWSGFHETLDAALSSNQPADYRWFWWAAIVAILLGFALGIVLLVLRRFGEATYVLGNTLILSCSSFWGGGGLRSLLIAFPLFLLLARAGNRLITPYLCLCAPLCAMFVVAFTSGVWVD